MVKLIAVTTLFSLLLLLQGCKPPARTEGIQQPLSQGALRGRMVTPELRVSFPLDHGTHDDFSVEWWYLTANLRDESGSLYPMQWTLFRFLGESEPNPWAGQQQFMAHSKLSSPDNRWFEERFARGNVGNAGITSSPFGVYLDDWVWRSHSNKPFPSELSFSFGDNTHVNLSLSAEGPFVLHGQNGYSRKLRKGDQASMYYSQPFIHMSGHISIQGEAIPVEGPGWFDHEWTSQYLQQDTQGWDWFSLHLDNGSKIMLFNMRHSGEEDFWSGSYIQPDGTKIHLSEQDIEATVVEKYQVANRSLPLSWTFVLPRFGLEFDTRTVKKDQWNNGLFSYYEGAIEVNGSVSGVGFMELTGY